MMVHFKENGDALWGPRVYDGVLKFLFEQGGLIARPGFRNECSFVFGATF